MDLCLELGVGIQDVATVLSIIILGAFSFHILDIADVALAKLLNFPNLS
jgi:hypothetical protein